MSGAAEVCCVRWWPSKSCLILMWGCSNTAQVGSLKDAMRAMAAERDAGALAAVAQLEAQLFAARSQIADLQAAAQQVCSFGIKVPDVEWQRQ